MQKLMNTLSSFDNYGIPIGLRFKKTAVYKTKLGVILTIAYLIVQVEDVLNRTAIIIYSNDVYLGDTQQVDHDNITEDITTKDLSLEWFLNYTGSNQTLQSGDLFSLLTPILVNVINGE